MLALLLGGLAAAPARGLRAEALGAGAFPPPWAYMEPMPWEELRGLVPALRDGSYLRMPMGRIYPDALSSNPAAEHRNRSRLDVMRDYCRGCSERSDRCRAACGAPNRWREMLMAAKLAMDEEAAAALRACRDEEAAAAPCESHSQHGEDAGLYAMFFRTRSVAGGFVELGALDGVRFSNSLFYEETLGWRGVLIEPSPAQFAKLRRNRGARNFAFNNAACLDNATVRFQDCGATGHLVAATGHLAADGRDSACPEVQVQCRTLGEMVGESGLPAVDLLSLDVEGRESEVLRSFDWRVPVHVLLIERRANGREMERLLLGKGFRYVREMMNNHVFVNRTWEQLPAAETAPLQQSGQDSDCHGAA